MAADLDQRSPDVSQWGVGSSVDSSGGGGGGVFNARSGVVEGEAGGSRGKIRAGGRCGRSAGVSSPAARGRRGTAAAAAAASVAATVKTGGVAIGKQEAWGLGAGGTVFSNLVHQQPRGEPPGHRGLQTRRQQEQPKGKGVRNRKANQQQQQQQQQRLSGKDQARRVESNGSGGSETGIERPSLVDTMDMESPEAIYAEGTGGAGPSGAGSSSNSSAGAAGAPAGKGAAAAPAAVGIGGSGVTGAAEGGASRIPDAAAGAGGGDGARARGGRPGSERLAHKLSVSLIDTYKLINQRYYAEKSRYQEQMQEASAASAAAAGAAQGGTAAGAAAGAAGATQGSAGGGGSGKAPGGARQGGVYNHGMDDENFDYIVHEGEVFQGRYSVRETIGKGSFGKVYKAWDTKDNIYVALKVIKSKRPFTMQAKVEVNILELLRERDPDGKYNCARMLDQFMSHNHQCLVFEILSFNLYELLRSTQFQGVSLHLVRKFARHLLRALAFLSLPQVDVIHCDLKPENILLQHAKRSNIKVIDFGSSCRSNNKMYSYIQSRFYRSPEVMLGLPYTAAIDMWSLGCILVEMHTGEPLFAGVDQFDQMCRIVSVLGVTPSDVVERSPPTHRGHFFEVDSSSGNSNSGEEDGGDGYHDEDETMDGRADGGGCCSGSDLGGGRGERDSDVDNMSPGLSRKVQEGSRSSSREGRRRRRGDNLRGGGGGGVRSSTKDDERGRGLGDGQVEEDEDSDDDMADVSPSSRRGNGNDRGRRRSPRYRLRRDLLLKRAKGGNGGGAAAAASATEIGRGSVSQDVPRVPLAEVVGVYSGGPSGRRDGEAGHDPDTYELFVNLVERMLDQRPETRITPAEALLHPFVVDHPPSHAQAAGGAASASAASATAASATAAAAATLAEGGFGSARGAPRAAATAGTGDDYRHGCQDEDDDGDDRAGDGSPVVGVGGDRSAREGDAVLTTPDGMQGQLSSAAAEAAAAAAAGAGAASGAAGEAPGLFFSKRKEGEGEIEDERGGAEGGAPTASSGGDGGGGGGFSGGSAGCFGGGTAAGGFGGVVVGAFGASHTYPPPLVENYDEDNENGGGDGDGAEAFGGSGDSPSPLLRPRSAPGRSGTEAAAAVGGGCSEPRHRRSRHPEGSSTGVAGGSGSRNSPNVGDGISSSSSRSCSSRACRAASGSKSGRSTKAGKGDRKGASGGGGGGGGNGPGGGSKVRSAGLRRGRSQGLPVGGMFGDGSSAVVPKRSGLRRRDDATVTEDIDDREAANTSVAQASVLPGGGSRGLAGGGLSVETRRGKALREGGGAAAAAAAAEGQVEAASRVAQLSLHQGSGGNRGVT